MRIWWAVECVVRSRVWFVSKNMISCFGIVDNHWRFLFSDIVYLILLYYLPTYLLVDRVLTVLPEHLLNMLFVYYLNRMLLRNKEEETLWFSFFLHTCCIIHAESKSIPDNIPVRFLTVSLIIQFLESKKFVANENSNNNLELYLL